MMTWTDLLGAGWKFVGAMVAAGGGGAVIAFALCRQYGEEWLEHHFAAQMEDLKQEKRKEIERIKERFRTI